MQAFRNSAPSSVGLTGKPLLSGLSWLSYSSSGLCPERRVWSATRSRLSPGRELPTPAKLNEPLGSGPLGRDLHPLCVTAASPARRRRRHVAVAPAPEACGLGPQGACHRIECRDYSDFRRSAIQRQRASTWSGLRRQASVEHGQATRVASGSTGQHPGEMVSLYPPACW